MKYLLIGSMFVLGLNMVLKANLVCGQDADAHQHFDSLVKQLASSDTDTRYQVQKRILKERNNMIAELVALIDDPGNQYQRPDSVTKAIETLGAIRAVEGIDVLTQFIGFPWIYHPRAKEQERRVPILNFGNMPRADRTPAVKSLIAIGEPCVPKVIAKLAETEGDFEHRACISVLRRLDEHVRVREALQEALLQASDEPAKQRIERALRDLAQTSTVPPETRRTH